ncbi:MAG: 30S ribosomal protein S6 [candidate division WOR-3 bacterium]|nr:30S ribosomal protein S6 [candidate division WOR-3 bacterium]MCX7757529.1 30S ribosomal protein S6 [candidate division WOR-3 bacterium]MDW7987186.1 30S ribosomal protein S6 [candidate division WOR-3 bacterium]
MQRIYKAIFIISSKLSENESKQFIEELKQIMTKNNNLEILNSKTEVANLPYPIRKETKGTYFTVEFKTTADVISKIREELKHRDEILRLTIIRKEQ